MPRISAIAIIAVIGLSKQRPASAYLYYLSLYRKTCLNSTDLIGRNKVAPYQAQDNYMHLLLHQSDTRRASTQLVGLLMPMRRVQTYAKVQPSVFRMCFIFEGSLMARPLTLIDLPILDCLKSRSVLPDSLNLSVSAEP